MSPVEKQPEITTPYWIAVEQGNANGLEGADIFSELHDWDAAAQLSTDNSVDDSDFSPTTINQITG